MVKYHRKKYTRKRSTLSNYKIATRTSARAQSKQIYALKKRMNKIYRMTKPEIRIQQRNCSPITLNANANGAVEFPVTGSDTASTIMPILGDTQLVTTNTSPINRFARLRSLNLYGNLEYSTLSETAQPISVRIVVVQTKTTRGSIPGANDVFSTWVSPSPDYLNNVFGPLQNGLARTCKVLSDKRYTLSYQRPTVVMRTNLKYLLSYYHDYESASSSSPSEGQGKGSIYVFYACYGKGIATNSAILNLSYKLAFIDN